MGLYIGEVKKNLFALSEEKTNFYKAVKEWKFKDSSLFKEDNPDAFWPDDAPTCALCGHWPINEICIIENNKNENTLDIGNECVKKFLGDNIASQHKETVKDLKNIASFKKNKIKFENSEEQKHLNILAIGVYGQQKRIVQKIQGRVKTKGGPTKKQYEKIGEIFESWYGGNNEAIIQYDLYCNSQNPKEKDFLKNLVKYKKTEDKMSEAQLKWYISIKDRK